MNIVKLILSTMTNLVTNNILRYL